MAEHFDLLANISFHGCDIDELEFTKLHIIEKIKDYDRKVRYELNQKNDITAIFNDNATYTFYTSNPYTQDLRLKQVTYSMIYLSIGCNNYNMNKDYWYKLFKYILNDEELFIFNAVIQLDFNGDKEIITNIYDAAYNYDTKYIILKAGDNKEYL